ncbi:unnamed protein product [Discosporangium mesarthrocarpum]
MPESRPLPTELVPLISALVISHFITLIVCAIFYFNIVIWGDYVGTIGWAILIGEALQSSKKAVIHTLQYLSNINNEDPPRHMLVVLAEMIWSTSTGERGPYLIGNGSTGMGVGHRALLGLGFFSLLSLLTLMLHLMPFWLLVIFLIVVVVPTAIILLAIDRNVFAYRKVISDNALATLLVISVLFLCTGFIFLFLGTESVLEGLAVAGRTSNWVKSALDDQAVKEALAESIDRAAGFVVEMVQDMETTYKGTLWWAPLSDIVNTVLQNGTLYTGLTSDGTQGHYWCPGASPACSRIPPTFAKVFLPF